MKKLLFVLLAITLSSSCVQSQDKHSMEYAHTNRLVDETSPYLLQHAHNPVDWYPWGEEAFTKAKAENKMVIVSVGYSACHWCHVMEHESFEDDSASKVMNERYINIKVDREERPDVDQIYMNAVQLMSGRGGWPLNCIVLPDGRPVWGGTYFRTDQWIEQINTILFSALAFANASSPQGYQSTGLCACCNKYGEVSSTNLLVCACSIECLSCD